MSVLHLVVVLVILVERLSSHCYCCCNSCGVGIVSLWCQSIALLAVPFATLHIFFDCRLGLVEVGGEQVLVAIIYVLLPLLVDGDCVLPAVVCCMVSCGALFP